MTHLEFDCSDKKAEFLLRAERLYDEGLRNLPEWIPCSERMPKDLKNVLVEFEWGSYAVAMFVSGNNTWITDTAFYAAEDDEIIAWMPLPEPYKESED